MKKFIIFTLSSLFILIIYTLLLKYFTFIKTKPDIILIIVIFVAMTSDKPSDILLAFTLGYIFDIFSGSIVGLFAMMRTIAFIITRFFNMSFFSKNILFFMIITFIVSIIDSVYLGYQFRSGDYGFFSILADSIYLSLINSVTALIIYPLLTKIEGLYMKKIQEA